MEERVLVEYDVRKTDFAKVSRYDYLTPETIDYVNRVAANDFERIKTQGQTTERGVLISLNSLIGLTPNLLDQLDSRIEYIQVMDQSKRIREAVTKGDKGFVGGGQIKETVTDYVDSVVIYSRQELREILERIEKIEEGLEGKDDFTKLVVIYDRLKRGLKYDFEKDSKKSLDTRSLRGLTTGKTVCAGYSEMLMHILKRNGIECRYINGGGHAWNEVDLNGETYMVDLTWDSREFYKGKEGMDTMEYFGMNPEEFVKNHHNRIEGLPLSEYSSFDREEIKKALKISSMHVVYNPETEKWKEKRTDGSEFLVMQVEGARDVKIGNNSPIDMCKYIYCDIVDGKPDISSMKILYSTANLRELHALVDYYTYNERDKVGRLESSQSTLRATIDGVFSVKNIEEAYAKNAGFLNSALLMDIDSLRSNPTFTRDRFRCVGKFIVEQVGYNKKGYGFNVYISTRKGLERMRLVSKQNLLEMPGPILKKVLGNENIEEMLKTHEWHLGEVDQNGNVTYQEEQKRRM